MKVGLAADHGGFEMKQQLAKLIAAGHEVVDFGNKAYDASDDYPDFAIPFARAFHAEMWNAGFSCEHEHGGAEISPDQEEVLVEA